MTGHEYLKGLLADQKLKDGQRKYLHQTGQKLKDVLRNKYGNYPIIYYGGSYGKKTMIRASFDLDIVIYFPHTEPHSIRNLYNSVYQTLDNANYTIKRKNVALRLYLPWKRGFHVDVVPGKAKDETYEFANLYRHGKNKVRLSSIKTHIDTVRKSQCRPIIKLMKLWKIRRQLNWNTFALERMVIKALEEFPKDDYGNCLMKVFKFVAAEITDIHLVDPANCNNLIKIPDSHSLKKAAETSLKTYLNTRDWKKIIPF